MPRRATQWFTEGGRPILHDGLYKNTPDGEFLYDFRLKGFHKKGSTGTKIEIDARSTVAALKKQIHDEHFGLVEPVPPTPLELWSEWDRQVGAVKSKRYRDYMTNVVHHHLHEWAQRPVTSLDSDALETLRARYMGSTGSGYKRGGGVTVRAHNEGGWNHVFAQIRTLFRWALMKKRIQRMPYEIPAKEIRLKSSVKAHGVLWPEEVLRFLDAVDTSTRKGKGGSGKKGVDPFRKTSVAIRLMVRLGLREGEALNLEWERVDWHRNVVVIAEARATGARVKDRSYREIPMGPKLEAYLRAWHERNRSPKTGLVIPGRNGHAMTQESTKRVVQRGGKALEKFLTPHGLRATFATGHWEIGTPLTQIAQMMGDAPDVVMRHYIYERPKDQAASQLKLEEAMENPQNIPALPSIHTK